MEKEFNLSEKRRKLLYDTIEAFSVKAITIEDVFEKIEEQDKEFIKRRIDDLQDDRMDKADCLRELHKDSGDKLI